MSDQFLGEIRLFACDFAPRDWAFCNGQLIPIQQNTALFSLVGTYYGGNGVTTFALPNLQSSLVVGVGDGPGLTPRVVGETGGVETVSLLVTEMPAHSHLVNAGAPTVQATPASGNAFPGVSGSRPYQASANAQAAPSTLAPSFGNQPHTNLPPLLAVNFCIALSGIYPARP